MNQVPVIPTKEIEDLRWSETKHAFQFALAFFAFAVGGVLASLCVSWWVELPAELVKWIITVVVAGAGFVIGWILWTGLRRGRGIAPFITAKWSELMDAEIDRLLKPPEPPSLPPSLPQAETFRLTTSGRVGEELVKQFVNGFDPRDLDYLASYLARGNKYSEAALERFPLPYEEGHPQMGGLSEGTRLTRFLDLCEAKGILSARSAGKMGKLLITDEKEIARRLKEKPVSE
jgi:hypothetical protein